MDTWLLAMGAIHTARIHPEYTEENSAASMFACTHLIHIFTGMNLYIWHLIYASYGNNYAYYGGELKQQFIQTIIHSFSSKSVQTSQPPFEFEIIFF